MSVPPRSPMRTAPSGWLGVIAERTTALFQARLVVRPAWRTVGIVWYDPPIGSQTPAADTNSQVRTPPVTYSVVLRGIADRFSIITTNVCLSEIRYRA